MALPGCGRRHIRRCPADVESHGTPGARFLLLRRSLDCWHEIRGMDPNAGGPIRIFGVSLLAVAALAAASLLWKRRQDAMLGYFPDEGDSGLDGLRRAGL